MCGAEWGMAMQGRTRGSKRGLAARAVALTVALVGALAAPAGGAEGDGLSVVSDECETQRAGSSNPTFYPSNNRMVVTEDGRQIVVYDAHGSAQQIAWRDPGGPWQTRTTGAVSDGYLVEPVANDRPATLALARDSAGREHAWLAWGGYDDMHTSAVEMRRLGDLDASSGPRVGPEVEVEPAGLGNVRVDLAFEGERGVLVWLQRTAGGYDLVTTWFTDLDSDTPSFHDRRVLFSSGSPAPTATLVPTPAGVRVVARTDRLKVFGHDEGAPLGTWWSGSAGVSVSSEARPSAVPLPSGDLLAAVESDTLRHTVEVVRFSADGDSAAVDLGPLSGYQQPALAAEGSRAWLVMVRRSDGYIVSRALSGSWSRGDRVEVGAAGGGDLAWPSPMRLADGRLRMLVDGPRCGAHRFRNHVLAFQRTLEEAAIPALSVGGARVTERDTRSARARFRVSLSAPAATAVAAGYATASRSARSPSDYGARSGRVLFEPGETSVTVSVPVAGDRRDEPNETFRLLLSKPDGASLGDRRGRATIVDDDPTPTDVSLEVGVGARIRARGTVTPATSGVSRVTVTLLRRSDGTFVAAGRKRPRLGRRGGYSTSFGLPSAARCRVVVKVPRAPGRLGSEARRTFPCGGPAGG